MSEESETGTVAERERDRGWEARIEAMVKRALETQLPAAIEGARGTGGKCYGFSPARDDELHSCSHYNSRRLTGR